MANINFKTINSTDYVSPNTINANFQLVDPLGYDYVTSQGTAAAPTDKGGASGTWNFRKWKSGIAECWGNFDFASGNYSLNVNVYFPFTFKSRPTTSVSGGCEGNNAGEVQYVKSSTSDVNFWISRGTEAKKSWAEVRVIGRIS